MNRRDFLRLAGMGAAAAFLPRAWGQGAASGEAKKLNFVFILADDYGWTDVGCYGSKFYETPNIDKLAAEGMRFTQAYAAAPVCSPTRASIQTGRYPARVRITNFLKGDRAGPMLGAEYDDALAESEVTIGEAMAEQGYETFYTGKWHLGGRIRGYKVQRCANSAPKYFGQFRDRPKDEYLTDRLTDETLKFIEEAKDPSTALGAGKPFFAFVGHNAVHVPLAAKPELIAKYQKKAAALTKEGPEFITVGGFKTRAVQNHAVYAAMIESLDQGVGRIMKKLAELKLDDRTAIIFMSDNGGLATAEGSPTANLPLRGGKGWLYEGGIREPLIVKWPGVTKAGSTWDCPTTSTDFFPTMLEMAGLPLRPKEHCDGVSIVPLLKGGTDASEAGRPRRERALYWHYPHYSNQGGGPGGAVRQGDWKLIEFFEDMHVELYNLKDDIGETKDLAKAMPERVAAMRKMLHAWREQVKAAMPRPNPKPKEAFPELKGGAVAWSSGRRPS